MIAREKRRSKRNFRHLFKIYVILNMHKTKQQQQQKSVFGVMSYNYMVLALYSLKSFFFSFLFSISLGCSILFLYAYSWWFVVSTDVKHLSHLRTPCVVAELLSETSHSCWITFFSAFDTLIFSISFDTFLCQSVCVFNFWFSWKQIQFTVDLTADYRSKQSSKLTSKKY